MRKPYQSNVDSIGNVAPLGICYREVFFFLICKKLTAGFGIPFLTDRGYHTYLPILRSLYRPTPPPT